MPPKKQAEKKVDLGQGLARRRSQDFAIKIQGWNNAGGGVLQKADEVVVVEGDDKTQAGAGAGDDTVQIVVETESSAPVRDTGGDDVSPATPKTPASHPKETPPSKMASAKKTGREVDLDRKAWVRRKSKPQVETVPPPPPAAELKQVGAPKKRVISDGHWRRDRTAKEEAPTPEKEKDTTPKPVTIRRSVASVGLKVPPSTQDFMESDPEPDSSRSRPIRHARKVSHSKSTDTGLDPDYESSGTKVYIQRRRRSRQEDEYRKSDSSHNASSSTNTRSATTDITTPSLSPPKDTALRPKSEPRQNPRKTSSRETERPQTARQAREREDEPRRPSTGRRRSDARDAAEDLHRNPSTAQGYARRITEHLRKPASPAPVQIQPQVHATRIDGWLANMPDPFTESRATSLTPEPLDVSKRTSRNRVEVKADRHDSWESRGSGEVTRSTHHDLKEIDTRDLSRTADDISEVSTSPSSTLKRRGASRKSPVKDRFVRGKSPSDSETLMSGALGSPPEPLRPTPAKSADRLRIPSGGKRLSTVVSVDSLEPRVKPQRHRPSPLQFSEDQSTSYDGSTLSRVSDGDSPRRAGAYREYRVKDHSDLMSVLSVSRDDADVMPAARRSTRSRRAKPEANTIGGIMNDFSAEEIKYQRELRTLVDGVVPVLLQHALSSKASAPATPGSRVFSRPVTDPSVTQPIIDMGIALERLKTCHKRVPLHEPSELLIWAEGASKLYSEYLRCWRLGFTGIVVNLAPADDGLPRNKDGDLVDGTGERVDVAYLLKRPLVRLKYLAKALKGINQLQPSANAEDMTAKYQDLIAHAKRRVNDEQARLEDEAASSIDATRARDPRSLAPITGVTIDPTRSVGARDYFDMDLLHSSGQQLGCKIEIVYRDDAPNRGKAGDVLFCEVSTTGRWLLFPPLPHSLVTARNGDRPGELIVMIRGFLANARQWREVMSLQADDEQTCADWIDMLGNSPMPPRLSRKSSFNMLKEVGVRALAVEEPKHDTADNATSRDPSPREIEIPLGEPTKKATRVWDASEVNSVCNEKTNTDAQRAMASRYRSNTASSPSTSSTTDTNHQRHGYSPETDYLYDKSQGGHAAKRPNTSHARSQSDWTTSSMSTDSRTDYSVWLPSEDQYSEGYTEEDEHSEAHHRPRPGMQRRTSSVPSSDMPTIPKIRKSSRPESPTADRDATPSQIEKGQYQTEPSSAPAKMQKQRSSNSRELDAEQGPPTPTHSQRISLGLRNNVLPSFTPAFMKKNRRPSSPLKHEYAPSTASYSLSESEYSDDLTDAESITSESTLEEEHEGMTNPEDVSTVGDLKAFHDYKMRPLRMSSPPETHFTMAGASLGPSESASQGPYRSVPQTNAAPVQTIAGIFCWSDRGQWDSLHPDECQIFVTPGLIEAFDITQANSVVLTAEGEGSTPSSKGIRPLVALELTPLVPLRRGTAVDISVRSPPSANSLIRTSNNVMFRSRSPEDCEKLYALINRARIENPTYAALQHARGPVQQSNWGEAMDRRNNNRQTSGSWWTLGSRKSVSYRSNGSRPASVAATESSVGTMNSAISALRRFSGGNRIFNIAKSTITSRYGTQSTNSESLSSGAATPNPLDPRLGTPLGVTNSKIRLYIRENASKWKDLGSARLTVMLPPRQETPASPRLTGMEKRVLVYGKSKGELLLDVTLGESAFERVARTGIAVSVYEEQVGPNGEVGRVGAVGGVLSARTTVYMVQMKSVSSIVMILGRGFCLLTLFSGTRGSVYVWLGGEVEILSVILLYKEHALEGG